MDKQNFLLLVISEKMAKKIVFIFVIFVCFCFLNRICFGETLNDAWEIAIQASRQLEARRAGTAAAEAGLDAASAARMPKITNTTAYTALSDRPEYVVDFPGISQVGIPGMSFNTPLLDKDFVVSTTQVIVPLYMGGKISSLMEQAQARIRAAESGEITELQELKINVAENYFLVLRLQGLIEVLQDSETAISAHEKNVTKMLESGLVTRNAYLAAQVAHADVQQKLIQAQNMLHVAEAAYNRYLWRPLDTPVKLQAENIPTAADSLENCVLQALSSRSELRQLTAESQAVFAQAKEHRAARFPHVAAMAGYTYIQNESLTENNYFNGTVGMVWTPFDGGVSRSRQRSSEMQATAILKMREELKSAIQLEVRKNWLEEKDSRQRVEVAQKAIEQAEENLRVVDRQFREGLVTHTEVLDAVALYTQARTNYCNAAYDAILATYRLRRAAGQL
ncbi:MAG: TolC family protein [Planctomycetia bacterium]|nr:TolC family protein [Planctomycetia bacterium]